MRVGLTTLTVRPAACRWAATAAEYGPVASMPKCNGRPPACRSAQAARAANPAPALGKARSRGVPSGASRQQSRVSLDTSMPTAEVVEVVPTASLPSGSRMRGRTRNESPAG
ncbi:hypothetical protein PX52LOC_07846 [Limnoglobus roseus]|uniref:Uncharacterized protein n=1 Tax=Limnoglobus roseus TaxID=2598579 RepID=A0A5C1ART0_9BACT|nr:hypothetical protein PX52LOC_07846 [Limnoglobus roseus]